MKMFRVEVTEFVQAVTAQDAVMQARARNPRASIIGCIPTDEQAAASFQMEHLEALCDENNVIEGSFTEEEKMRRELHNHNETARALALGKIVYGKKRVH